MDVIAILESHLTGEALRVVVTHGRAVAGLALAAARGLALPEAELGFIAEAAMLHDIGVCRVELAGLGLHAGQPYIMHGILGREILEGEGLPRHALVCERHIGVGLTLDDIVKQGLPLPLRDMTPQCLSEEIICFADLFFSKDPARLEQMKPVEQVRVKLAAFGADKVRIFDAWMARFGAALGSG
ncbi:MAG: HD domain-containing protein [Deltaproteobacteria bacterium]|nr:HD domain-containing protein [Deltaproteobacteria bacterium]